MWHQLGHLVVKELCVIPSCLAKHVGYPLKTLSRLALLVLKDRKDLYTQMSEKNCSNKLGRVIGFRVDQIWRHHVMRGADDVNWTMVCYFLSPLQLELSRTFSQKAAIKKQPVVKKLIGKQSPLLFLGRGFPLAKRKALLEHNSED